MKKVLILIGSDGALGSGLAGAFRSVEDYSEIHLFGRRELPGTEDKVTSHKLEKLSGSSGEPDLFGNITTQSDTAYFMVNVLGGFTGGTSLKDTELSTFTEMLDKNYYSALITAKCFLKQFANSAGGSMCFTTALSSFVPSAGRSAYDISKGALNQMIYQLAEEIPEMGFSVNAIAPLLIDTPANRNWVSETEFEKLIQPAEIASFIASVFRHYHFLNGNIFKMKSRIIKGK